MTDSRASGWILGHDVRRVIRRNKTKATSSSKKGADKPTPKAARSIDGPPWLHEQGDAILLDVTVVPKSSRTRILDVYDKRLKIQLTAPPVEGQANEMLVRFIADTLGIAKVQVDIVGGAANKKKTVRLRGVARTQVFLKLSP